MDDVSNVFNDKATALEAEDAGVLGAIGASKRRANAHTNAAMYVCMASVIGETVSVAEADAVVGDTASAKAKRNGNCSIRSRMERSPITAMVCKAHAALNTLATGDAGVDTAAAAGGGADDAACSKRGRRCAWGLTIDTTS